MTVNVTITVSDQLADLFPKSVNRYNSEHGTEYNNKEMIKKLAIDFVRDRLHELEHIDANTRFDEILAGVPEYEDWNRNTRKNGKTA